MKEKKQNTTAQSLLNYPGLENLSPQKAEQAAQIIQTLTRITFRQMIRPKAQLSDQEAA